MLDRPSFQVRNVLGGKLGTNPYAKCNRCSHLSQIILVHRESHSSRRREEEGRCWGLQGVTMIKMPAVTHAVQQASESHLQPGVRLSRTGQPSSLLTKAECCWFSENAGYVTQDDVSDNATSTRGVTLLTPQQAETDSNANSNSSDE